MSGDLPPDDLHGAHAAIHGHGDTHAVAPSHGTLKTYLTGFGLSVVLTAIPFWLVMTGILNNSEATALSIMALAVGQIVVHMVYFLHMNAKSEGGWTMMALIFTLTLVVIVLTGSLWVMYHLNTNMMPQMGMPNAAPATAPAAMPDMN